MIDRVFKGCLVNWKFDDSEQLKKSSTSLGQIIEVEDTKQIKGTIQITNQTNRPYDYEILQVDLIQAIYHEETLVETLFTEKILQQQAGRLQQTALLQFQSKEKKLPYTTILCQQQNIQLRTYLQLSFRRRREENIAQYNIYYVTPNHKEVEPIKIEVGAENALQVEISVPNSNIDILNGILLANVHFVTAQKKMKEMKVFIKRREGIKDKYQSEWQDIYKMQTMDGAPFRNELIPIRIQMNKLKDIGCSYESDQVKIQYEILVSVIDIDDQNYFKEVPLTFYCEKQQIEDEESSEQYQKQKKSRKSRKE